jgi:hypothetical protein
MRPCPGNTDDTANRYTLSSCIPGVPSREYGGLLREWKGVLSKAPHSQMRYYMHIARTCVRINGIVCIVWCGVGCAQRTREAVTQHERDDYSRCLGRYFTPSSIVNPSPHRLLLGLLQLEHLLHNLLLLNQKGTHDAAAGEGNPRLAHNHHTPKPHPPSFHSPFFLSPPLRHEASLICCPYPTLTSSEDYRPK